MRFQLPQFIETKVKIIGPVYNSLTFYLSWYTLRI